jgi:hypothetical protein
MPLWPSKKGNIIIPGRMENMNTFGGFHQWGYPQIADFFDGKSIYKWMMTGRSIIYGNLHV